MRECLGYLKYVVLPQLEEYFQQRAHIFILGYVEKGIRLVSNETKKWVLNFEHELLYYSVPLTSTIIAFG